MSWTAGAGRQLEEFAERLRVLLQPRRRAAAANARSLDGLDLDGIFSAPGCLALVRAAAITW